MPSNELLWNKIRDFQIDDPFADFSFSDRLARENGWSLDFALGAVEEYKKFMYLLSTSSHSLTPSDEVDQVWHLHLIYTHSYWDDFCDNTLGKKIHHGPTKGGKTEKNKYEELYALTLEAYSAEFECPPPSLYWPSAAKRFNGHLFRRIDITNNWIIKKPFQL